MTAPGGWRNKQNEQGSSHMLNLGKAFAIFVALYFALPANPASAQTADTVLFNGKILTVDKDFSINQALAIGHGQVLASGTTAAMKKLAADNAKLIDLDGRTVIPGLTAKSVDGASAFSYPLIFLPFISSAFVLTDTMPGPVRAFAENQPVTPIVDAIRDLYTQQPVSSGIWIALAWCLGLLSVAYALAIGIYHRKIS